MSEKILHIVYNDKFIVPFIDFVKENKISGNHFFLYFGGRSAKIYSIPDENNIDIFHKDSGKLQRLKYFLKYFYTADKIILHGLFDSLLLKYLYLQPWLLKKCYWVMWGGDLYYHILANQKDTYILHEKFRKRVIGKMGHFITYIKGDYELAQKWYGAKGEYHECIMYPSNLYKEYEIKPKEHASINIQIGNSANPTNNHFEVFKTLEIYKNENIKLFVPLSYGKEEYAKSVIEQGNKIFGHKFQALTEFMPFDEYLDLLSDIDIAIFNHNRQQAMGNTITLLGLGKKVYLRRDVTPYRVFKEKSIKTYDLSSLDLTPIELETKMENQARIKNYFSKDNLVSQWEKIFKDK